MTSFESSTVCTMCGREQKPELLTSMTPRDWITEPITHIYSRKKRFKNLTENLFWPAPSQKDNRMLAHLQPFAPFATKKQLFATIKKSTLSDKRYSSIHFFCKTFVTSYKAPPPLKNIHHVLKQMLNRFGDIEFCFSRLFSGVQFFNYAWLLSHLLKEVGLDNYIQFVKLLKCKQRVMYYDHMLVGIKTFIKSSDRFNPPPKICMG